MYKYSFEKLDVWIEAKELTKSLYGITTSFPDTEKFGLVAQLRRASVSICSNLAEGSTRTSHKDKAHFSTMAFGSAVEILNQLVISFELNFIEESDYVELRKRIESISNKINALRNFQLSKSTNPQTNK
jgi:four helix bundle protein